MHTMLPSGESGDNFQAARPSSAGDETMAYCALTATDVDDGLGCMVGCFVIDDDDDD